MEPVVATYETTGQESPKKMVLRVTSATYPGNLFFERELTDAEKAAGVGKQVKWNGISSTGNGPLANGGIATAVFSPYRVELVGEGGLSDGKETRIEVSRIALEVSDDKGRWFMNDPKAAQPVQATIFYKDSKGAERAGGGAVQLRLTFVAGAGNALAGQAAPQGAR